MKKLPLFLVLFLLTACSPTIYKSNDLAASKITVRHLAILPYLVSIDSKRLPKGMTLETLKQSQEQTGFDMQNNSYTWFLRRSKDYTVTFQDIDQTNAILKKKTTSKQLVIFQQSRNLKYVNYWALMQSLREKQVCQNQCRREQP